MPVGDGADPAAGGDREPGPPRDQVATPEDQRARLQHPGRRARAGDQLISIRREHDRRPGVAAPGQQDRAHRPNRMRTPNAGVNSVNTASRPRDDTPTSISTWRY